MMPDSVSDPKKEIERLLTENRLGALATFHEGKPFASLVSFAYAKDMGAVIMLVSQLTRHAKNMDAFPWASVLVSEGREPEDHPLNKPRVTLSGKVEMVGTEASVEAGLSAGGGSAHQQLFGGKPASTLKKLFLSVHPESEMLFQLKDFSFYVLKPTDIHFVRGFGSVSHLSSL